MRKAFVNTMEILFEENPKVVLFLGDIGAYLLRNVRDKHPNRFFNVGISEAAMMSAASGMALDGWIPFVYTITPFITSRCFDQIRIGVGFHNANVKIVGIGSGVSYSMLGSTHHSIEDNAIMRTVPGMHILTPKDSTGAANAIKHAAAISGPVYIRLTANLPYPSEGSTNSKFNDFEVIQKGKVVVIFSYGETTLECLQACEKLKDFGINPTLVNVNKFKPLSKTVVKLLKDAKYLFSVEEHSTIGGLGSAIAELVAEMPTGIKPQLTRIGVKDEFLEDYGHKHELYLRIGLDSTSIFKKIKNKCTKA